VAGPSGSLGVIASAAKQSPQRILVAEIASLRSQ
jgi:hypothetical protein